VKCKKHETLLLQNIYAYGLEFVIDVNASKQINEFVYAQWKVLGFVWRGIFKDWLRNFMLELTSNTTFQTSILLLQQLKECHWM
jgi:hypothetical protein